LDGLIAKLDRLEVATEKRIAELHKRIMDLKKRQADDPAPEAAPRQRVTTSEQGDGSPAKALPPTKREFEQAVDSFEEELKQYNLGRSLLNIARQLGVRQSPCRLHRRRDQASQREDHAGLD